MLRSAKGGAAVLLPDDNCFIAERILFVPPPMLGPVVETLPVLAGVLLDLRASFEVEVLSLAQRSGRATDTAHLAGRGGGDKTGNDGRARSRRGLSRIDRPCLARSKPRSKRGALRSRGRNAHTRASLADLGLPAMSRVTERLTRERLRTPATFTELVLRPHLEGLDASEAQGLVDQCVSGSDMDFLIALTDSMGELELSKERRTLQIPALLFQPPDSASSFYEGEGVQLFGYFAPQAKVRQLRYWPQFP
jgi:hypothetical protein